MYQVYSLKNFLKEYKQDVLFYHFTELEIIHPYNNIYKTNGFVLYKKELYFFRTEIYLLQNIGVMQIDVYIIQNSYMKSLKEFNDFKKKVMFNFNKYKKFLLPYILKAIDNQEKI